MAKQIKVIKCPNCGSVQKTEIKPEHYRCDSCETEYFLDNDDININIKHQSNTPNFINIFMGSTRLKIICASLVVIITTSLITTLLKDKSAQPPQQHVIVKVQNGLSPNSGSTSPKVVEKKPQIHYEFCSTVLSQDKPYVLTIEDRVLKPSEHDFYFVIYDLMNNKKVKETQLPKLPSNKYNQVKWEHLDFTKDKTYFVINSKSIFLLDKINYKLTEVTQSLLSNHPDYQTGIASVSFSHTTSGKALHILTNDGKKLYYFPMIDEVYLDDYDFQMVKNRPKKPPVDTSTHLAFSFANAYGQDHKLIKYEFISPDGKNHIEPRSAKVGAFKQDGTTDKHSDVDSAYDLINVSNVDVKIVSHQNLTPGRLYFDPAIIYSDSNTLIIKTKVNAAPDADYNYQQIDINTGKVLWTLSDNEIVIKEVVPYTDGFITKKGCDQYAIIDNNGKINKQITLTKQ